MYHMPGIRFTHELSYAFTVKDDSEGYMAGNVVGAYGNGCYQPNHRDVKIISRKLITIHGSEWDGMEWN